jgi:signal transduction histidine kinase
MSLQAVLKPVKSLAGVSPRWRRLRLPYKVAAIASALVLVSLAHLGAVAAAHVRENVIQQSAAAAALLMEGFVGRYVQELATEPTLSTDSTSALRKLLSPASMHRPVVAFRIWKGDTVTFSNEPDLIGKAFASTAARDRAWGGHVAFELSLPDGDDDSQVNSLDVPVLEVYAPVREGGTGRIIALVEIYELAVGLEHEIIQRQVASWAATGATALTIILLLFSMASSRAIERNRFMHRIAELSQLQSRSEQVWQKMRRAGLHVSHMNERSLQHLGTELHEGPGQLVALALLKFDALNLLIPQLGGSSRTDERRQDLEVIRKALEGSLRCIHRLAGTLPIADLDALSVPQLFERAVGQHQRRTGVVVQLNTLSLPEQLPAALKAYLYRLALEGLDGTSQCTSGRSPSVTASCNSEKMVLQFAGCIQAPDARAERSAKIDYLRNRVESVGGQFRSACAPTGELCLTIELCLSRMDALDGL